MNRFYLDTEYSNGNFYLGDIFDLALIAETSGHVFQTLIRIPSPLDNYVQFMCNITDKILQQEGMTHSEFLCDFPLLLTNCIKNKCDIATMLHYRFIDTVKIIQKEIFFCVLQKLPECVTK